MTQKSKNSSATDISDPSKQPSATDSASAAGAPESGGGLEGTQVEGGAGQSSQEADALERAEEAKAASARMRDSDDWVHFVLMSDEQNGVVGEVNVPFNGVEFYIIPCDKKVPGPRRLVDYLQSIEYTDWKTHPKTGQAFSTQRPRFQISVKGPCKRPEEAILQGRLQPVED